VVTTMAAFLTVNGYRIEIRGRRRVLFSDRFVCYRTTAFLRTRDLAPAHVVGKGVASTFRDPLYFKPAMPDSPRK